MKTSFSINFIALFAIHILILFEIKDLFDFEWNLTTFIVSIFAFFFVMLILIIFINILFNFILTHFTSYKLDYEENQGKVLNSIFLVNEILFLCLYVLLLFDKNLFFTLQDYKYITPFIFSILFSILLNLRLKDIFLFNFGILLANGMLMVSQKLFLYIFTNSL